MPEEEENEVRERRYGGDAIEFGSELEGLEGKQFSTILIDPPWRFQNRTGKMSPEHMRLNRYETMRLDDIKRMPVGAHAAMPCHLYMWCPNALLKEGLEVMEAWGFQYKTNLVWYKVRKDGGPDGRGVGFYFRNVTELILVRRPRSNANARSGPATSECDCDTKTGAFAQTYGGLLVDRAMQSRSLPGGLRTRASTWVDFMGQRSRKV